MSSTTRTTSSKTRLPEAFRPLFWSYRFEDIDPQLQKKTIIVQLLNYGTLDHWKWLVSQYGRGEIRRVLQTIPATEIRKRTRELAGLLFSITNWRYAQRGTH